MLVRSFTLAVVASLFCAACQYQDRAIVLATQRLEKQLSYSDATRYTYKVMQVYPHDPRAFTEGLLWDNGSLFESTGLYSQSTIRKVDLRSGGILKIYQLAPHYFGEGLAVLGQNLYQLTYQENRAFRYDKETFQLKETLYYPTAGWGLTTDGRQLVMSDGTSTLYYVQPDTFHVVRQLNVHTNRESINNINELEYAAGKIYANVWPTNIIIVISASSGKVEGWINVGALNRCSDPECVANGVAFDKDTHALLVTGKYWQNLYAIKISP